MPGTQPIEIQKIQATWLREWHRYMVNSYAMDCIDSLEVGCGSGCVMRNLEDLVKVRGIDIDLEQVDLARDRGLVVDRGDAADLDYPDGSFDLVYSSFFLMWVPNPDEVIDEMIRVSRRKVMFLSEPIWSRSIFSPHSLKGLVDAEIDVISKEEGDPDSGLALLRLLGERNLTYRFGTVPMDTTKVELSRFLEFERSYLSTKGRSVRIREPEFFHVPFIWAAVNLSG
ncbi:MAG: class I SAM-dependent methyltransferase [Thermoplasmatota archaeon]